MHYFVSILVLKSSRRGTERFTGPRSSVGNVSGNKCESDCRSKGREFDPGPVHTFMGIDYEIISTVILLPSAESNKQTNKRERL